MSELEGIEQKSKLRRLEGTWNMRRGDTMTGKRIGCKQQKKIQKSKSNSSET